MFLSYRFYFSVFFFSVFFFFARLTDAYGHVCCGEQAEQTLSGAVYGGRLRTVVDRPAAFSWRQMPSQHRAAGCGRVVFEAFHQLVRRRFVHSARFACLRNMDIHTA